MQSTRFRSGVETLPSKDKLRAGEAEVFFEVMMQVQKIIDGGEVYIDK
ncbi:hypothetical protein [uncultured Microscilla sp.]|nr:hypothetical protein [uncultured Microscilla sp.]